MLSELAVSDLGVLAHASLVLGPGMTAVTGETGAGKTLLVTAIELLVGGRADPSVVRPGAAEARVEGRFLHAGDRDASGGATGDGELREVVLARVVPRDGRSRAYVDGRLAPVAGLGERGAELVDLHGQHAHQALLDTRSQRAALDAYAEVDLAALAAARSSLVSIDAALAALGGDERARARELDLLAFQLEEIDAARIEDPDEEEALDAEEDDLGRASEHRMAAAGAAEALVGEGGAGDAASAALSAIAGRAPFAELEGRLRAVVAELAEAGTDLRVLGEGIEEDPERLEALRARRARLRELRRKYGATLGEVVSFAAEARARAGELVSVEARAGALEAERSEAEAALRRAEAVAGRIRRGAAPELAAAVTSRLAELALPRARIEVAVGDAEPGDDVRIDFGANAGEPVLPLSKVASGGELARVMLALRLALATAGDRSLAGRTLVFDEVDAGVGGAAAAAVGRALATLAADAQVLVVTHLPQVAAAADAQVVVTKAERDGRTVAEARLVEGVDRVVELSRMLSGSPDSAAARDHAEELLDAARHHRALVTGR